MLTRTLTLTTPRTKGADVREVQAIIGVNVDGEFGPISASTARQWKWDHGYPKSQCKPTFGPRAYRYAKGVLPLPKLYKARAALRKRRAAKAAANTYVGLLALKAAFAFAKAGVKEVPAGSNVSPPLSNEARRQGLSAWLQAMGWPWCAYFVGLCLGKVSPAWRKAWWRMRNPLYCPTIYDDAAAGRHGMRLVSRQDARPGDGIIFNFPGGADEDHIGFLASRVVDDRFESVEGNTSYGPGGSQANGGAVALRSDRTMAQVRGFIRWPQKPTVR